jgi:hypothetical protein
MRKLMLPVLCLTLVSASAAFAQSKSSAEGAVRSADSAAAAKAQLAEAVRVGQKVALPASTCVNRTITCGQTVQQTLGSSGCTTGTGGNVDFYTFTGTNNEQANASLTTAAFIPFLELIDPHGNDVDSANSNAAGTVTLSEALNQDGTWSLGVTNFGGGTATGAYSLTLTCGSTNTPTCVENANTLCVANNRFQIRATFNAGASGSGDAQAVALTSDTGYLWFFDASNVEMVVKVLDACALNNKYWVFAGGLTNVNVVMTVTDLQTGTSKTYTNPASTEFQPIQDTSAFATCP